MSEPTALAAFLDGVQCVSCGWEQCDTEKEVAANTIQALENTVQRYRAEVVKQKKTVDALELLVSRLHDEIDRLQLRLG